MELKKIKKFAIDNGYDDVEFLGRWEGFEVYYPFFNDDESHIIGLPLKILVKDDDIRISEPDESMILLDVFE